MHLFCEPPNEAVEISLKHGVCDILQMFDKPWAENATCAKA